MSAPKLQHDDKNASHDYRGWLLALVMAAVAIGLGYAVPLVLELAMGR